MSSDVINFNKPCSACRRRKVRCDKAQPCNNCIRHRVSCVYEAPRESVMSQQVLQDRVERLERMMEDLTAFSLSNHGPQPVRRSSSSATSPFSSFDDYMDIPSDVGNQVFGPNNSYHMGPDSWMNMDHLGYSPHHLLNVCLDDDAEQRPTWTMSMSHLRPKDLTHFHLPIYKEDVIFGMFFDHVEPFIRINHQGHFWQLIGEFRSGTCAFVREVEALMFATQHITASVLPATLIQEKLGLVQSDLINHLQRATEFAFDQANIMRSRSTVLFNALLYYITTQFHTGNCEAGSTLLGLASSIARRIGMHRDPAYYGYTAWCVEMRRRMWGHLAALDAQSCNADGSESVLMTMSDVQRPLNINDSEWNNSKLPRGDPGPRDREGFSDASTALIRREICRASHNISEARKTGTNCYDLMAIVEETTKYVQLKFLNHFDGSDPMHHVMTKWYGAMIKSLAISVLYLHASPSRPKLQCHSFEQLQGRLYEDCLACLEDLSQGEKAATEYHWQWAFRWPMPLHVIAGLLSCLSRQPDHRDSDRAWEQIGAAFRRYNNDGISMAKVPAWHSIETLCDQAMLQHPNQKHEGRAYTKRMHTSRPLPGTEMHKLAGMPCGGVYGIDVYEGGPRKQGPDQVAPAEVTISMGFSDSDIDAVFFNVNGEDEYLSIDI
ncbi:hypothetical protein EDB81DRAFT_94426 [Dactylonectria macrodidyma]|uniref:Zn(2)-C6 fungal-type domain-containing protein n=1 Tax=Dactylonectria macrodidyma TaxID=307937 RepID=A0A9P9EBT0_9HYPO|nr:hypothetical protein EDB81DRAFT_94426 [Dactylonectria macrodidyma]